MSRLRRDSSVSVVLPVWLRDTNLAEVRLLGRAIESVQAQSFPDNFEILIVDDGSPTPVEKQLESARICLPSETRIIRCDRNSGIVNALNLGVRAAQYPLIARLDADDAWRAGKIEKQLDALQKDPDLSIVGTGMQFFSVDGVPGPVHIRPSDWAALLNFFVDIGCPFPHGSILADARIYRLLGGYSHDVTFRHCEDYALWGLWLRFFKPSMIEEALYDYTTSSDSVSNRHSEQQLTATHLVMSTFSTKVMWREVPRLLADVASLLGITVMQAGVLAYRMWRFGETVALESSAIPHLQALMPDRWLRIIPAQGFTPRRMRELLAGFDDGHCWQQVGQGDLKTVKVEQSCFADSAVQLQRSRRAARLAHVTPEPARNYNLKTAVVLHLFHVDLYDEILLSVRNFPQAVDLLVTCPPEAVHDVSERFARDLPVTKTSVVGVPNRGRDIGPFLSVYGGQYFRYDLVCKLHTKKSTHDSGLHGWRSFILERLVGSPHQIDAILSMFASSEKLGLIFPDHFDVVVPFLGWSQNYQIAAELCRKMHMPAPPDNCGSFPSGSMFWFRPDALRGLIDSRFLFSDFPEEQGQTDGTVMHAVERLFLHVCEQNGYGYAQVGLIKARV